MKELDAVRREFVQLWGAMGHFWGISPTTAKVHSWLLSSPRPADTEEIMQGLEMSRGAVSMACRELRDWGLIFPEKEPGERRMKYRPATDLEKVIRNIVRLRKRREWDPVLERLQEWLPQLRADTSEEASVIRERLESLEAFLKRADALAEIFLKGGMVGRIGLKLLAGAGPDEIKTEIVTLEPDSTDEVEELILEDIG